MPVDDVHPEYGVRVPDWEMVRDGLDGERAVKDRRTRYLPAPPGMQITGAEVLQSTGKPTTRGAYEFYLSFAEFPEILEPALNGFQGVVHARPPKVQLPSRMDYLEESATPDGESLRDLWQTVTREVLSGGRVGILADISRDDTVRFVSYAAENITNWEARPARLGGGANFVVLCEIRRVVDPQRPDDPFATVERKFWRELRLVDDIYKTRLWSEPHDGGNPQIEAVEDADAEGWVTPVIVGKALDRIPFVCVNALEVGFEYGAIPILPLARRCFSIYRLTADYRRALHVKGDPQPYVTGIKQEDAPREFGGTTLWTFEAPDANPGYLDISGDGIPLMRDEIEKQLVRFDQEGGRLLSTTDRPESGAALVVRTRAHQVTLRNVVITAAAGVRDALQNAAEILRVDSDAVVFDPDLDFAEPGMTGREALEWSQAEMSGFPLSKRTLHGLAVRGGVTELTFEEEMELIEDEGTELASVSRVPDDGSDDVDPDDEESSEPESGAA